MCLSLATEIEGHPDNVAASLLGGLVICDGPEVRRIEMPPELEGVLLIPHRPVRTSAAREALPEVVPMADAVHNLAQIAKLTAGLTTSDWGLIAAGLGDRLHQPYRAHLYPRSAEVVAAGCGSRSAGSHHLRSRPDGADLVPSRLREEPSSCSGLAKSRTSWAEVRVVQFEPSGATVTPL